MDFFEIEKRRSQHAGREFWSNRRTFGRVALTREHNPNLRDKAGREGIIDNKASKVFRDILAVSKTWWQGPGTGHFPLFRLPSNNPFLGTTLLSGISSISFCMACWDYSSSGFFPFCSLTKKKRSGY